MPVHVLGPRGDSDRDTSALLAAIVAASDDAIVSKDLHGIITSWNAAAERLFGYTPGEAIGRPITIIIPPDRLEEEAEVMARVRRGERVEHLETVRCRKDGGHVRVSLRISPVRARDGTVVGASKIGRDMSEQQRAAARLEEEIRIVETLNRVGSTVASTLDRESIVRTVIDAATELTRAAFGALFYHVGRESVDEDTRHSVSGPSKEAFGRLSPSLAAALFRPTLQGERSVRVADITTDARFARSVTPADAQARERVMCSYLAVPIVSASGRALGGLIFGHPDRGVFTERHERLAEGIAGWTGVALENARHYEEVKDANRMKDELLAVLSHELRTPLNAIMGWADMLTSTRMDGPSRQRALRAIQRNSRVQAQLIEHLLDVSRIANGVGLGIVKNLIEAHGESVTAASEGTDKGAVLTVRRPLRHELATPEQSDTSSLPATQLTNVRALVVDDDRDSADLLVYALVQCGAAATAVSSAAQALRVLGDGGFNVLLADIGMPDVDGYGLIRAVRAREGAKPLSPIAAIAVTAHAAPGDRERALTAGFDWHLTKPVDAREVIDLVARMATGVARSKAP